MSRSRKVPSPEHLAPLRRQLQEWRKVRTGPEPMPEDLWAGAVALAKEFGICPIARVLPVDYTALRKRVERPPREGLVKPTFVQLPATVAPAAVPAATIAISATDSPPRCLDSQTHPTPTPDLPAPSGGCFAQVYPLPGAVVPP